jgi:hypothetical protein
MIKEIAIALFDSHGGIEEGDIVQCRKVSDGIGLKEAHGFLWFRADISDQLALVLASTHTDASDNVINKRRFQIPLTQIQAVVDPNFDISRARDINDNYQPYLAIDAGCLFTDPDPQTFELEGMDLIWDKSTGDYV